MFWSWFTVATNLTNLGLEAQHVIALRLMRLGQGGPNALAEAQRMISDKIDAALEAQAETARAFLSGRTSHAHARRCVAIYRRRVETNRKRLA
jgi:hypothetical protein